ncbi:3'-5' exonuclease [Sulfitobacter sp.]|uniref:3'-5' exonuclease n=1 Tax=Sulfitobacter sp. TaxID=1903071 RepID=UPI003F6BCE3F
MKIGKQLIPKGILEELETLPIKLPDFEMDSPPFSRGTRPEEYTMDGLKKISAASTERTNVFRKYVLAIEAIISGPVLARTPELISDLAIPLHDTHPALNCLTMHDAKGSEFQAVAVIALDSQVLPDEKRILSAKDEGQLDEVMSTERHLLYVGATRARDYLWISGSAPISEFLMDLLTANEQLVK